MRKGIHPIEYPIVSNIQTSAWPNFLGLTPSCYITIKYRYNMKGTFKNVRERSRVATFGKQVLYAIDIHTNKSFYTNVLLFINK